MASTIRIKRSSVSGNPTTLAAGELAYSALSDNGANGGDRLYIGMGAETSGNAANHIIVGGRYYTGLIDAAGAGGSLNTSANSIPVLSATGTIDKWYVGNLYTNTNTISATNVNGGITLTPNGTGYVTISGTNGLVIPSGTSAQQGPSVAGAIRFNTTTTQYEGYNGTNWTSMGGVRSVDGLTYIIAETSPGASDDVLHFYAANGVSTNVQVATLDSTKLAVLQTTSSSNTSTGALVVSGGVGIAGNLNVGGTLGVTGAVTYTGGATFNSNLTLAGSTTAGTELFLITDGSVTPVTKFSVDSATGNTVISGTLSVSGTSSHTGNATFGGTLDVTGATTLSNTLNAGATTLLSLGVTGTSTLSGNTSVGGTLGVTGATTLAALSATTGTFSSTLSATGDFAVNTNKFNVTAASGNTSIAGTLGVTGAATLSSTLGVTGAATFSGTTSHVGASTFSSTVGISGDLSIATNKFTVASVSGNTAIAGTLGVTSATTLSSTLGVTGATTLSSTLGVTGASTFSSTVSSLGDFSVAVNKFTVASTTGNTQIAGTLGVTSDISVNTNKFNVTAASGNTSIAGTLNVTGAGSFNSDVNMNSHYITNLADPVNPQDAATKSYVDAARSGLDVKASVKVASTGNLTLSAAQTIDGVAVVAGDRVLVKDQTTAAQNGIYVVAAGSWARAADADANAEVTSGMFTFVEEGTTNGSSGWVLTTTGTITVDTTALAFGLFSVTSQIAAGNGLVKNGNQFDVNVTNGITVIGDAVQLASTTAGAGLIYTSGVLDIVGTTNRITVNSDNIDIASTYVGQPSITTLGTIGTGVWQGTTVAAAYGGSGQSSYSIGDILVASGATALSKLAIGVAGKVLQSNGTTLVYADIDGGIY